MGYPQAKFDPKGGPITVEVVSGFAQGGSYDYTLWESDEKTKVEEKTGHFSNDAGNKYTLPVPNAQNDKRIVEFDGTVAIIPPLKQYLVTINAYQDNRKIGTAQYPGGGPWTSTHDSEDVDVFLQLVKA